MFFVFIWEQTATCATYSINWLVFITEKKSVYNAVKNEYLNKAVWVWNLVVAIAGGKEAEGVWEYRVEENIWT